MMVLLVASALLAPAAAIAGPRGRKPAAPVRPVLGTGRSEIVQTAGSSDTDDGDDPPRQPSAANSRKEAAPEPFDESVALEGLARIDVLPPAIEERIIDLPIALQLAEAENPTIALGRQAIVEAVALQTGARGLLLPTLNAGTNYHLHQGVLLTSFGQVRNLNEQSLYVGGGARTLAAETVAIPAVRIFSHLGDALFAPLAAGQVVCARSADSIAIQNAMLLTVVRRYLELAMAEAALDAIHQGEDSMRIIVLSTAAFASTGQGREGDYQRARADALLLHAEEQRVQEEVAVTSAERSPAFPQLPTVSEAGVPGYAAEAWYGLYAPARTPSDIIDRLNKSAAKAVQSEAFKKLGVNEGLVMVAEPPEALDRYFSGEEERWRKVIQDAGIKIE
jgi:hypothetical protein